MTPALHPKTLDALVAFMGTRGGAVRLGDIRTCRIIPGAQAAEAMRMLIKAKRVNLVGADTYTIVEKLPIIAAARAAREPHAPAGVSKLFGATKQQSSKAPRANFLPASPSGLAVFSAPSSAETGKLRRTRFKAGNGAAGPPAAPEPSAPVQALARGEKVCATCSHTKPANAFSPHGRSADGLCASCDACRGVAPKPGSATPVVWKGDSVHTEATVFGVYCLVSPGRATVFLSEPGANEERTVRVSAANAIRMCRFILAELGATEP